MVQISNNPAYSILRVKFKKVGDLQYISHLDLVRTMHKIIVRAKLPLWYTEGFNPKPKMTFAAPLSIGTESLCEFMDLRVTEKLPPEEIASRLNANMTEQMQVLEAYYPETGITELGFLSYTITVKTNGADEDLTEQCRRALATARIEISKKTKSGEATADIKPLIKSADLRLVDGRIVIDCVLSASPSAYLNPEYIVKYLRQTVGILSDPALTSEWYTVLRTDAYTADMRKFR